MDLDYCCRRGPLGGGLGTYLVSKSEQRRGSGTDESWTSEDGRHVNPSDPRVNVVLGGNLPLLLAGSMYAQEARVSSSLVTVLE